MTARRRRIGLLFVWVLLAWLPWSLWAAQVQASLDRNQVALGDTVTLNLRVDGDGSIGNPDLAALQASFDILGTSSSTSVSIINGQRQVQVTYGIALRPRRIGSLLIPPLNLPAGTTQALKLEVVPASQASATSTANGMPRAQFLETSVQPDHGYVGQQLLFTTRLFFSTDLRSGSLDDPQVAGVDVRRIGDDSNYVSERDGRQYHVIERRYALIPQRAGRIDLPAVTFQGEAVDPRDPDSFFGASAPVSVSAPPQHLQVQAAPVSADKAAWLPARGLNLRMDGWPSDGQARVNQPLNITLSVQATGLPSEALPTLSLPSLDGATVYPDKPANITHDNGQWLLGQRQQGYAIVPTRPGRLHIPAITLNWWNVQTDHAQTAQIPAHDINVLPAAGAASVTPAPAQSTTSMPAAPATAAAANAGERPAAASLWRNGSPWPWIALLCLLLWLLSMLGWLLYARRQRQSKVPPSQVPPAVAMAAPAARTRSPKQSQERFLQAADGSDVALQTQYLLAWARAERPQQPFAHLGELSAALADPRQHDAIAGLQRARYALDKAPSPGLRAAFAYGLAWRRDDADDDGSPLPPLYPFKLH